jgi:hypothetical protein
MSSKLVQNASRDNKAQTINYCLTNEPCNRRRNMARHLNISLPIVTHDNSSMKKNISHNNITLLANLQKNSNN